MQLGQIFVYILSRQLCNVHQACVQSIIIIIALVQNEKLHSNIFIPWQIILFYIFKLLGRIMLS